MSSRLITPVLRAFHGVDQLVQLELHRGAVPVLGVLNEEYHQESDAGRGGVEGARVARGSSG